MPVACLAFARKHAARLRAEGLRAELAFHLFALWDFNLLDRHDVRPPPPPSPRTNRTRRVPHPVLIGHAASLTLY